MFTLGQQEVELNKKRPLYIKAKEKTTHMQRKVENSRWVTIQTTCISLCVYYLYYI